MGRNIEFYLIFQYTDWVPQYKILNITELQKKSSSALLDSVCIYSREIRTGERRKRTWACEANALMIELRRKTMNYIKISSYQTEPMHRCTRFDVLSSVNERLLSQEMILPQKRHQVMWKYMGEKKHKAPFLHCLFPALNCEVDCWIVIKLPYQWTAKAQFAASY